MITVPTKTASEERTLLPPVRAAQALGLPITYFCRAVRAEVLPKHVVIRVGKRKRLIDVTKRDEIVAALAAWDPENHLNDDREVRLRRIVGGGS
jgi:hypothetical protein